MLEFYISKTLGRSFITKVSQIHKEHFKSINFEKYDKHTLYNLDNNIR